MNRSSSPVWSLLQGSRIVGWARRPGALAKIRDVSNRGGAVPALQLRPISRDAARSLEMAEAHRARRASKSG